MKRTIQIIAMILILSSFTCVYGADKVTVVVDGKQVISDTPAVISSTGSAMLPFRSIFNALGIEDESINWNYNSKSIEVHNGGQYIFLMIGNTGALINDSLITLNTAPYIENNRTLVPIRFVSEALGADVQWIAGTKTVVITSKH
jgi:hypothetical protein